MLPREHGAWAQLLLPLVAALAAVPVRPAGALLAVGSLAAFLAQEPLRILLGHRGRRAAETVGSAARPRLVVLAITAVVAGLGGIAWMPEPVRWSVAVPAGLAVVAVGLVLRRMEKSLAGEIVAALTLTACAFPVVAADSGADAAAWLTVPLALVFVLSTLSVRIVIAHRRRPVSGMARAAVAAAAAVSGTLPGLAAAQVVVPAFGPPALWAWVAVAIGPAAAIVIALMARPPHPRHLRQIGWSIAAASTIAAVAMVIGLRTVGAG